MEKQTENELKSDHDHQSLASNEISQKSQIDSSAHNINKLSKRRKLTQQSDQQDSKSESTNNKQIQENQLKEKNDLS